MIADGERPCCCFRVLEEGAAHRSLAIGVATRWHLCEPPISSAILLCVSSRKRMETVFSRVGQWMKTQTGSTNG